MILNSDIFQFVVLIVGLIVGFKIYQKTEEKKALIEEEAKTERARMYIDRDIQTARIESAVNASSFDNSTSEEGGDMSAMATIASLLMKKPDVNAQSSGSNSPTWEIMKEQLKDPNIKKIVMDHKKEVLEILQS